MASASCMYQQLWFHSGCMETWGGGNYFHFCIFLLFHWYWSHLSQEVEKHDHFARLTRHQLNTWADSASYHFRKYDLIPNVDFILKDNLKGCWLCCGSSCAIHPHWAKKWGAVDIFGNDLVFILVRFFLISSRLSFVVSFSRHSDSKEAALCD